MEVFVEHQFGVAPELLCSMAEQNAVSPRGCPSTDVKASVKRIFLNSDVLNGLAKELL
jgi:hypothetical protein